jgi:hypothetical protein
VKDIELSTWSEFEGAVQDLERRQAELIVANSEWQFQPLSYRGLGNHDWGLETTLERAYPLESAVPVTDMSSYYRHAYAAATTLGRLGKYPCDGLPEPLAFDEMLREACLKPPLDFFCHAPWYRYFIYLRHHGFPSPFLDWTASPHRAAFFAFDSMDKNAARVSVYAVIRGDLRAGSDESPPSDLPMPDAGLLRRHFVQECRYSFCFDWKFPCQFAGHRAYIERSDSRYKGELVRWSIPRGERVTALKALERMDINRFSLFCDDDSLVATIGRQEFLLSNGGSMVSSIAPG